MSNKVGKVFIVVDEMPKDGVWGYPFSVDPDTWLVPVEPKELAARIAELSTEYYDLGNHGDGLPRIGYRESVWLAERLLGIGGDDD